MEGWMDGGVRLSPTVLFRNICGAACVCGVTEHDVDLRGVVVALEGVGDTQARHALARPARVRGGRMHVVRRAECRVRR